MGLGRLHRRGRATRLGRLALGYFQKREFFPVAVLLVYCFHLEYQMRLCFILCGVDWLSRDFYLSVLSG